MTNGMITMGPIGAFVIGALNLYKHKQLGKIWLPDNDLREDLLETYEGKIKPEVLDKERVMYFEWLWDHRHNYNVFHSRKNAWVFLGPEIFGKQAINEISNAEVKEFIALLGKSKRWKIKIRFIGTADIPVLEWGYVNLFDLISIEPIMS